MEHISRNPSVARCVNWLQTLLTDSGEAQLWPGWQSEAEASPLIRMLYLRRGEVHLRCDGGDRTLQEGHACAIPPGISCALESEAGCRLLFFSVRLTLPDGTSPPCRADRPIDLPVRRADVERLAALYRSADPRDILTVAQALYRDLFGFLRETGDWNRRLPDRSELVLHATAYIQEHLSAKLTVARVAEALDVPTSTLTKRFRRELDLPPGAYIDRLLLERAQRLLRTTDLSVREIADALEFCDPFYFSRFFRLHQQETPSRYRRAMREKRPTEHHA